MSNKNVIVYWASEDGISNNQNSDWSILYEEPKPLIKEMIENSNEGNHIKFFQCPSVRNLTKNIFVFKNPIHSSFSFDKNGGIFSNSKNHISSSIEHKPTIENSILFKYGLSFYFFTDCENLEMEVMSPFFSRAEHLQYGSLVPGSININSWFRSTSLEFNLWNNVDNFILKENEPIVYFKFNSTEQVVLQRFKMNDALTKIAKTCATGREWETGVPLAKRYERFRKTKTQNFVLQEIQRNLINE